jgi:hypothetical protein
LRRVEVDDAIAVEDDEFHDKGVDIGLNRQLRNIGHRVKLIEQGFEQTEAIGT